MSSLLFGPISDYHYIKMHAWVVYIPLGCTNFINSVIADSILDWVDGYVNATISKKR